MSANDELTVVELNVGGVLYTTTARTLKNGEESSTLKSLTSSGELVPRDASNRIVIDRDGTLFRYVLDYLRTRALILPENFTERMRLKAEAEYFRLPGLVKMLDTNAISTTTLALAVNNIVGSNGNGDERRNSLVISPTSPSPTADLGLSPQLRKGVKQSSGCIIVGYRGTFANGRDGLADVKFRKISRILVCGRVQLMREVFGDTLNESRDPDHGVSDRYTSRFFLKHTFLEQAFDTLLESNFTLVCAAATGTNATFDIKDNKVTNDTEENKWLHYNEFIFIRKAI